MWVISVNYPVCLALIFLEFFFGKNRYLFRDVATNRAPLYYCVRWYLNTEGQPTVRCTTCRLLRPFSATDCEASQYKVSISFDLPESNACRVRIRVITTNNILLRMQGLTFPFGNIGKRCSFADRNARPRNNGARNNKMDRITNYTACAFPLMRRYCMGAHTGPAGISSFHNVSTAVFTAQQRWSWFATGYRKCDKQEKGGTS